MRRVARVFTIDGERILSARATVRPAVRLFTSDGEHVLSARRAELRRRLEADGARPLAAFAAPLTPSESSPSADTTTGLDLGSPVLRDKFGRFHDYLR